MYGLVPTNYTKNLTILYISFDDRGDFGDKLQIIATHLKMRVEKYNTRAVGA